MVKNRKVDIIFYTIFVLIFVFLLYKVRIGSFPSDESFYITIPKRLLEGDSLLLNEWHVSQLSSVILFPFYKLYIMAKGTNEGVILFFRVIYMILNGILSTFVYNRLKVKYKYLAILPSLMVLIYVPFNICALSYNTILYLSLICFVITLGTTDGNKKDLIFCGLMLACAVLGNPLLVILFILYICCCVVFRKNEQVLSRFPFFKSKSIVYLLIGIAIMFVIFLIIFVRNLDFNVLFKNISHIINTMLSDPERLNNQPVFRELIYLISSNSVAKICLPLYLIIILFMFYKKHNKWLFGASLVCAIIYSIYFYIDGIIFINYFIMPIFMIGLSTFVYSNKKDEYDYKLFMISLIVSIVYCICVTRTSNQKFYCVCSAASISIVIDLLIIQENVLLVNKEGKLWSLLLVTTTLLQLFSITYLRFNYYMWEKVSTEKTFVLDEGPGRGISVNSNDYSDYLSVINDLKLLPSQKGNYLVISPKVYVYLFDKCLNSSYSGWMFGMGDYKYVLNTLDAYYKINSNKIPRYILIEKENVDLLRVFTEYYNKRVEGITEGKMFNIIVLAE